MAGALDLDRLAVRPGGVHPLEVGTDDPVGPGDHVPARLELPSRVGDRRREYGRQGEHLRACFEGSFVGGQIRGEVGVVSRGIQVGVPVRRLFQLPTSFVRGAGWMSGRIRPNGMAPRPLAPRWLGEVPMARDANAWIDREIAGCRFADERLGRRLRALLVRVAGAVGGSIPLACQDWANT